MLYLFIALSLALALAAGVLGWRLVTARTALEQARRECEEFQQDRVIRQNLQQMLDSRNAEVRRLRARLHQREDEMEELEKQASDLNINLFHESSLRILREKEEAARRMKAELLERQLDEASRQVKAMKAQNQADEARMTGIIREQQALIDKLNARLEKLGAAQSRRAARRVKDELPNQMTMTDLLADDAQRAPQSRIS